MDSVIVRILLGFAAAHLTILLAVSKQIWAYIQKQSIIEYQHELMWDMFKREHLDKEEY
jgi:hypothetical protein